MYLIVITLFVWSVVLGSVAFLSYSSRGLFLRKGMVENFSAKLWRSVGKFSSQRVKCFLAIVVFAIVARLLALPILHVPEPRSHDEFSYILAGETFAAGRLTNPTPPLWQYFETEHELLVPTYTTKYPPLQSLVIAVGILLGNKWIGVLLNFGLMCGAIYWMACGMVPTRWAFLAGLLPLVHPGIASYWVNSYFGGSVAAVGGALTFGASSRLMRNPSSTSNKNLLVLGAVIMANSRPFEGALTAFVACSTLAIELLQKKKVHLFFTRSIVVPVLLGLLALTSMLYYNYRVTGDPISMPYSVWQRQYSPIPIWAWSKLNPAPHYNNQQFKDNYDTADTIVYRKVGTLDAMINFRFVGMMHFFVGVTLMPCFIWALFSLRDKRVRPLWLALLAGFLGITITAVGFQRHYAGPVTGAIYLLLVQGFRHLRLFEYRGVAIGIAMARAVLVGCVVGVACGLYTLPSVNAELQHQQDEFPRLRILEKLNALPGKHLIVVHYASGHNPRREYVVNEPDLDSAKVVWARDFGDNKELLNHFRDRTFWLFDPDCKPEPRLYTWDEAKTATLSTKVDDSDWKTFDY